MLLELKLYDNPQFQVGHLDWLSLPDLQFSRNLLSIPNIQQVLGSILERYPGKFPVMVNELNAWIDRKLGYRATHPEFPDLPL
jgi:hypothetical protein